jgi:hypothetical protein
LKYITWKKVLELTGIDALGLRLWESTYINTFIITDLVSFQVLMAVSMKAIAFWDIALCSLEVDRRLRGMYCRHHHSDDGS